MVEEVSELDRQKAPRNSALLSSVPTELQYKRRQIGLPLKLLAHS